MSELIAVEGMTLVPSDPNVVCTITIVGAAQVKEKCEGNGMYVDGTIVSVTAITYPSAGATIADPGPYNVPLNASAIKTKAEGTEVLREGDSSDTVNATPQIPASPSPTPYPISFTIDISVAGQTTVRAE